jgi:type VI secretion system secreted protein VgrG
LKSQVSVQESVAVGQVTHKLKMGSNEVLSMRDFPGEYAGRFDGVNKGGAPQPAEVQRIFQDNSRTVGIRMQQEAVQAMTIQGISTVRQIVSGHKFTLERHFNADGQYVVTSVQHDATFTGDYRGGESGEYLYENSFTSIPMALPFRPPRVAPKPTVEGTHTAVVVGPVGQEIFTDKYGRVKVQFNWDREGTHDADSSCWVRVTQPWAGKRWGHYHIPRIGQEVIVDFLEGDADQPIITGMVFNADQMPTYLGEGLDPKHPHNPNLSGIKTCSTPGGDGYNELRFNDTKGKEQVFHHCERNQDTRVKNDSMENIDNDKHMIVGGKQGGGNLHEQIENNKHQEVKGNHYEKILKNFEKLIMGTKDHVTKQDQRERVEGSNHQHVKGDRKILIESNQDIIIGATQKELVMKDDHHHVKGDRKAQVEGNQDWTVQGDQKETVQGDDHRHVVGNRTEEVNGNQSLMVSRDQQDIVGSKYVLAAGEEIHLLAPKVIIEASERLTVKGPGGFMDINPGGLVIQGILVRINSGGSAGDGSGTVEKHPKDAEAPQDAQPPDKAKEAKPVAPNPADNSVSGKISPTVGVYGQPTS